MPAFMARWAISSTLPGVVEMDKRTPSPFLRSRPFFQSSWFKPIWVLPARSILALRSSACHTSQIADLIEPSSVDDARLTRTLATFQEESVRHFDERDPLRDCPPAWDL